MSEEAWDRLYRERREYHTSTERLERVIPLLKESGVRRVLDLGCGSGAHALALAREGFEVWGLDFSREALKLARERFERAGLKGEFVRADIYEPLPFKDGFFDAVVSFNVIHHNTLPRIRGLARELCRIIHQGGLLCATLKAWRPRSKLTPSEFIDERTYVPMEGPEKGVVHHYFNLREIRQTFKGFRLERWEWEPDRWWKRAYYLVVMRRKSRR